MRIIYKRYVVIAILVGFGVTSMGHTLLVANESALRGSEASEGETNEESPVKEASVAGILTGQGTNATTSSSLTLLPKNEELVTEGAVLSAEKLVPREIKKAGPPAALIPPTLVPPPVAPPPPPPSPAPLPIPLVTARDLDNWFKSYAEQYGVDESMLRKIAVCESGYNTNASNGPYLGLFQFSSGTWTSARNRMGLDSNSELRASGEESIKTAAYKISVDGTGAWANCD